eukprot:5241020-Amphidinium_carterae.1
MKRCSPTCPPISLALVDGMECLSSSKAYSWTLLHMHPTASYLQLDAGDAFGSMSRQTCMEAAFEADPSHEFLTSTQGIPQGGSESPALFALGMTKAEKTFWDILATRRSTTATDCQVQVRFWLYVDDITLRVTRGWEDDALESWQQALATHGMTVNDTKPMVWVPMETPPAGVRVAAMWNLQE